MSSFLSMSPAIGDPLGTQIPDARQRLDAIVAMMREMSAQTDPEAMVRAYGARVREMLGSANFLALSRRGLNAPYYRITRSNRWSEPVNPWTDRDKLPVFKGGLLGELIYGDEPRIIDDLIADPDDPAYEYLSEARSLMAIPNYDRGVGLNMTIRMRPEPNGFDHETFPEHVWMSNLFGRATQNLVLADELKQALGVVDRELKIVADLQRSLLPREIPAIPNLGLAAHYQTSQWAGGDYYDFFALPDNKWGLLIADVSGHGTPAAVMMAITHTIAHGFPGHPMPPNLLLEHVNEQLTGRYTVDSEAFVTAFYGIFDPARRELTYACAGHNPPRLKRCEDGSIVSLDGVAGLPLGLFAGESYERITHALRPGDQILFYTDGVTDALNPEGEMFGLERLDETLESCHLTADGLIREVLAALERFTAGQPAPDDQTLLIAKVS